MDTVVTLNCYLDNAHIFKLLHFIRDAISAKDNVNLNCAIRKSCKLITFY